MKKEESNSKKESRVTIFQGVAAIISALILGYMGIQARIIPVKMAIGATQTAEAHLVSLPTVDFTATAAVQHMALTQQAFSTSINLTEQSIMATATAMISNSTTPTSHITPTSTPTLLLVNTGNIPNFFQGFLIPIYVWVLFALVNKPSRNIFIDRVVNLISKPLIFNLDKSQPVPFYPRKFLEQIAKSLPNMFTDLKIEKYIIKLSGLTNKQIQSNPRIFIGNIVKLIMFIYLLWSDVILFAISLTSIYPELQFDIFEPLLNHYGYSIISGTFLSLTIGGWLIFESKEPNNRRKGVQNIITVVSGIFLIISSLIASLVLSLSRYSDFGLLPENYSYLIDLFDPNIVYALILLNNFISTSFIIIGAIMGVIPTALILATLILLLTDILIFINNILSYIVIFLLDIMIRINLIYLYLAAFLLITPIDMIFNSTLSPFKER